jgi:hypothetical protein
MANSLQSRREIIFSTPLSDKGKSASGLQNLDATWKV